MNVFIAADMEGATGVVHHDQLMPEGKGYASACKFLTADVNAVIEGIVSEEPNCSILVGDGHGIMRNVMLEQLHPAAELVIGPASPQNKSLCQLEGISDSTDLLMMVGYHSQAGYPNGLLAHTYVGSIIRNFLLNGKVVGEISVNATVAASYGVSVGLISGNSDLAEEIKQNFDYDVEFVSVKRVLGPTAAICKPPAKTSEMLHEASAKAVAKFKSGKLNPTVNGKDVTMVVETYRREATDKALEVDGLYRVGECAFGTTSINAADAFRHIWKGVARSLDETANWLR